MNRYIAAAGALFLALGSSIACAADRALILGIDLYQPAGTTAQHPVGCTSGRCILRQFDNLEGAVNDALSIADLLTSSKFAFLPGNVVLLTNPARPASRPGVVTLPAEQTCRDGILAAMQKYLVDLPQPGDTVVFYVASHGSLRVNTAGEKLTLRVKDNKLIHVDSTLVPADAYLGGYDVRDHEIARIFNAALDKGVHLTAIFDTCHSGGIARGVGSARLRFLPYDPRPITDPPETLPNGQRKPAPADRPQNPAIVFSAVQQDQSAQETVPSARLPEVHGAFTAALVETLQILPANASAATVYRTVKAILEGQGVASEDPDLDATAARRQLSLIGGTASSSNTGKVTAAALGSENAGTVSLDIGTVSGVGAGSEFSASLPNSKGERTRLRITQVLGMARSNATVISPANAKVQPGEVFELTRLSPALPDHLRLWLGPANLSTADILAAVSEIKTSGVSLVSDPVEEPYTDLLSWSGSAWTLQHVLPSREIVSAREETDALSLGAKLSYTALRKLTAKNATLWVDLPVPRELATQLNLNDPNIAAQTARSLTEAHYVLAGTIAQGKPSYAWVHKAELAAGPSTTSPRHSPGCSTSSSYPARSDWVTIADPQAEPQALPQSAAQLNTYSLRLARVHGWLQLANGQVAGTAPQNFYKLALVSASGTNDDKSAPSSDMLHENDRMKLALKADSRVADPLWVYILDIDCHGEGTLLYPRNFSENQYPGLGDDDPQIILRQSPTLKIGPPYGVDTMILLGTAQPLPDPTVLDFEGVAHTAARGNESPLARLFANTSSGMRGLASGSDADIPMGWTIQVKTLLTVPQNSPQ